MDDLDRAVQEERAFIASCEEIGVLLDRMTQYREDVRLAERLGHTKGAIRAADLVEVAEDRVTQLKAGMLRRRPRSQVESAGRTGSDSCASPKSRQGPGEADVLARRHAAKWLEAEELLRRERAAAREREVQAAARETKRREAELEAARERARQRARLDAEQGPQAQTREAAAVSWDARRCAAQDRSSERRPAEERRAQVERGRVDPEERAPGPRRTVGDESLAPSRTADQPRSGGSSETAPGGGSPPPVGERDADSGRRAYVREDLLEYRARSGLTQRAAAARLGVAPSTVAKAELLPVGAPLSEQLQAALRALPTVVPMDPARPP